jgi:integrase/recombinase XerD
MSFDSFIRERRYVHNVSPRTLEWYACAFRWLPNDHPSTEDLKETVIRMREAGLKPTAVNSYGRVFNAYCHWLHSPDTKCHPGCGHPHLKPQAEPREVMPTYSAGQVTKLIKWKPTCRTEKRLHLLVLFLLDTGCRISEALTVRLADVDFDNQLVTLTGKGNRQRIVPFSVDLSRILFRYTAAVSLTPESLLFDGMDRSNTQRAVRSLCDKLGFDPPARVLHSFRHTFALNYLRRGGSTFHLQKSLGHSSLEMTRRYSNLTTADLSAVCNQLSLLHNTKS